MNLVELRKERHHIAAQISSKKKAGKDVTELKAQEKTIVTMIANMVAAEKTTKKTGKPVAEKADPTPECGEKERIINALKTNNGKRKETAKALGISERTLYRRLNQYSIAS